MALGIAFTLLLFGDLQMHGFCVSRAGQSADVGLGKAMAHKVAFRSRRRCTSRSQPLDVFKKFQPNRASTSSARPGRAVAELPQAIRTFGGVFGVLFPLRRRIERGRRRAVDSFRVLLEVGYPRFCVSQARVFVVLGACPDTCVVLSMSVSSVLDTLTPMFELYVWLRERRQRTTTCVELLLRLIACSALVVGASSLFPSGGVVPFRLVLCPWSWLVSSGSLIVVLPVEVCLGVGTVVVVVGFARGGVPCGGTGLVAVSMVVPRGG
ncbi:hypothetical protein Taro_021647, partial [Colocasia esculenta]|nr:hypothetical protein [Colocasia esculenta]